MHRQRERLAPIERVFVEQLGARIGCGCLRFGLWGRYVVRVQIVARALSALRVYSERCVPGRYRRCGRSSCRLCRIALR